MANLPDELAALPPPELIEELDYEARLDLFVTQLVTLMSAAGISYDVDELEGDPAKILLEVATFIDTNLRQRINEAVRANLLPYAYGGDLDILAQFYDVTRLDGEDDDRLRRRVVLAIRGRSPGGTAPRYAAVAMGADVRVSNVNVYTIGKSPVVYVAVFSSEAGGVPDQPMLDAVEAALHDPEVRMVSDTIVVRSGISAVANIVADVWLTPGASTTILVAMEESLRAAWAVDGEMGRDLNKSYISAKLMLDGVQDIVVTSPASTVVADFNEAIAIGTVTLVNRGRQF